MTRTELTELYLKGVREVALSNEEIGGLIDGYLIYIDTNPIKQFAEGEIGKICGVRIFRLEELK